MTFFPQGSGLFTIDPNATPEQLARKRELLASMMPQFGNARYVGQGIGQLATGIAAGRQRRQIDKIEGQNRDRISGLFDGLFSGGGRSTPPFVASGGSSYTPPDPNSPEGIASDTMTALGKTPDYAALEQQYGLPQGYLTRTRQIESGGNPNAQNPNSSAGGDFQFIDATAQQYGLTNKNDPFASADAASRLAADNKAALTRALGREPTAAELYLAHQQGAGGASKLLANPNALAVDVVGADAVRLNGGTADMTAGEFAQKWTGKFGGGPERVTQAGGGMDLKTLAEIAASPYASPGQRTMAEALLKQQMQALDPAYALDLQLKRKQVEAFGKPEPVNAEYNLAVQQALLAGEPAPTLTEWKRGNASAGAANTTVTVGGEESVPANDAALRKKLGEKEGEVWSSYLEAGSVSAGTIQDMQFIDELIGMAPQGPISGRLASAFPGFNSAADAFNSVVKRVAPTLRAPGSGSTSDIEYDGMLKSLPQLAAKPEANRAIAAMMKAKAEINVKRAEIVRAAQNDEIGVKEARRMMSELDQKSIMTPELKSILGDLAPAPQSEAGAAPDGVEQELWEVMSPEERALWAN